MFLIWMVLMILVDTCYYDGQECAAYWTGWGRGGWCSGAVDAIASAACEDVSRTTAFNYKVVRCSMYLDINAVWYNLGISSFSCCPSIVETIEHALYFSDGILTFFACIVPCSFRDDGVEAKKGLE
jgi:hypothetical protein